MKNDDSSRFHEKYKNLSVRSLKRSLSQLKSNNTEIEEIRFRSKLIRSRLDKRAPAEVSVNLTEKLKTKFWSTCHDLFNKATNSIPTFTINVCVNRTSVELSLVFRNEISSYRGGYRNSILLELRTMTFHRHIKKSPRLSTDVEHLRHPVLSITYP